MPHTTVSKLAPNDLVPCPSPSSLRRHLALAEHCPVCGTSGRRAPLPSLQAIILRRRRERLMRGVA